MVVKSSTQSMQNGVLEGRIMESILFLFYIKDLPYFSNKTGLPFSLLTLHHVTHNMLTQPTAMSAQLIEDVSVQHLPAAQPLALGILKCVDYHNRIFLIRFRPELISWSRNTMLKNVELQQRSRDMRTFRSSKQESASDHKVGRSRNRIWSHIDPSALLPDCTTNPARM